MIHVLGRGSIGSCVAANLAQSGPVRFLLRTREAQLKYKQSGEFVQIKDGDFTENAEIPGIYSGDVSHVQNLVVAVKAHHTLQALERVKHNLSPESTILLLQNGVGQRENLFRVLWPNKDDQPQILRGIVSFGVKRTCHPNYFIKSGTAPVLIESDDKGSTMLNRFLDTSLLFSSSAISSEDMGLRQLEKVAINAAINPTTALLNCTNGEILDRGRNSLLRQVVSETCHIIRTHAHRNLSGTLLLKSISTFATDRIYQLVEGVCRDTAENRSSMCVDLNAGMDTEIDFINGYIIDMALKEKLSAGCNAALVAMVKLKLQLVRKSMSLEEKIFI